MRAVVPPIEIVPMNASQAASSSRSAWLWGGFVTAFLILQLVIGGAAFYLASGDPSVAVVPDYHTRAIHWDEEMQRRRASDSLGWQFTVDWSAVPSVSVTCLDRQGQAVQDGRGSVRYYHHTRAAEPRRSPLTEAAQGRYQVDLALDRPGLWTVQWQLQRGEQEAFSWEQEIELLGDGSVTDTPEQQITSAPVRGPS